MLLPSVVRARSWLALGLVVGFVALATEWPRFRRDGSERGNVHLATWNIGAGNGRWLDALEPYEPDVVLVQESLRPAEIWEGFQWHGTPDPGLLTRYPAELLASRKVGPWTEPQLAVISIRGRRVLFVNVRLMLPSIVIQLVEPWTQNPFDNHRARVAQYDALARLVREAARAANAEAIVVAGDFNVPARMQSLDPLREFLDDSWLRAGEGWGATVPERFPFTRIDHLWVSAELKVIAVRAVRLAGSDHRAIVADLAL